MILVVGATGALGGRIASDLLARGKPLCVLARRAAQADALRAAGRGRHWRPDGSRQPRSRLSGRRGRHHVAALETFDSPVPMEETARTYGVTLTSVAEFVRAHVAAAR
jgi:uncharacterized protein YbjT (DUF2867 family)